MRADFDRFIDLYFGPNTGTPGVLRAGMVPARLVPDEAFVDTMTPLIDSVEYLTMDLLEPTGPTSVGIGHWRYTTDYGACDRVALISGDPVTHQVVRVEARSWPEGANYWRAHITPLFEPGASPCALTYSEQYKITSTTYGVIIVNRTGPTTWTDGTVTLEAEVAFFNPCTCLGHWSVTGHGGSIASEWNGQGTKTISVGSGPWFPGVVIEVYP